MTPEIKLAPIGSDRKNDYIRHKEKQKIHCYSDDYGYSGFYLFPFLPAHIGRLLV
ncbi:hypothetical protein SPTER_26490 [Sporomusa termitida]|uniref:Uncharacterized protein n=1 Tax=Sporomusa termitida TaxID=2377 RepID=A0A517DV82_9FIRM|nr:hypothetical protein SPTER_26490 [Sporomusa termitida]